ncbi:MAG: diguanylate cyclase [Turicibacter sanguinis]|uniref:GGDEF domain-containing protein n=1 Tax=Turicibacter sanguinis TaxID=154288 RepID=UPI001899CE6F|nr:GGDEF domain-containing protein [Turicibacter sanguinis]MCU7197412.1 GGDEF domain-containing protein [Turicibacter sanguinis]
MKKVIVLFVLLFLGCMDVLATDVVTSVSLSENEEIWLENSTQIKYIIGYPASITPLNYSYFSSSLKGVVTDISQEFNVATDKYLYSVPVTEVKQNRDVIDFGIVDVMISGRLDDYGNLFYSSPIHEFEYTFFVNSSSDIKSLDEITGKRVGVVYNDSNIGKYLDSFVEYPNYIRLYEALDMGEVDCIFVPGDLFMYQSAVNELREVKVSEYSGSAWYFVSDKRNLISILNKVMARMQTVEEYADTFMNHQNSLNSKLYDIDKKTHEWLFYDKPMMRVGVYDVAPFMYQNGESVGGLLDYIVKQIKTNFGMEFEFVFGEYEELKGLYDSGEIDILPVFNFDFVSDGYDVYQGQLNAYANYHQLLIHDEISKNSSVKIGSILGPIVYSQGFLNFNHLNSRGFVIDSTLTHLIESLDHEIQYLVMDPVYLDYFEQYELYQKGKMGKYTFSLLVQDDPFYKNLFDAISKRDFLDDKYSTLLATEMYLYEMSKLRDNLYSMQQQRLLLLGVFIVTMGVIGVLYRQRYMDKKTEYLKYTDYATGLLNRVGYENEMNKVLKRRQHFAFIIFDIDYFKSINDTYGHLIGDKVIEHVAYTIKSCTRKGDIICRLGGDEFVLCLMMDDIAKVCTVLEAIQEEMFDYSEDLKVTASIGVTIYEGQDCGMEMLYHEADQALYKSKKNGRNQFNIFSK